MARNEVMERYIKRLEKQKKIISNYEYISWLENFTLQHENFADNGWLYHPEDISKSDLSNVEDLSCFFEGISSYCHKYHINTEGEDTFEVERVHIKHNNVGYQIGLLIGQGALTYVTREEPKDCAVDFHDIVYDKKPETFDKNESLLKELESVIISLKSANIPKSSIEEVIKRHIK